MRFINCSFNGICGDIYDRHDYGTHATDIAYALFHKHRAITYKTR